MIDVVYGKSVNPMSVESLVNVVESQNWTGTLYIGYPIFDINDETVLTDAILISREHGVVIFDMSTSGMPLDDMDEIVDYQDSLYLGINAKFSSDKSLADRKGLKFDPVVISIRANKDDECADKDCLAIESIVNAIRRRDSLSDKVFSAANASVQKTAVLKPNKKRKKAKTEQSYGWKIKNIEKQIANLDKWQKKAAVESPDKPQRIRGLAGCGKTIILAMKAAYLHAYNPEARILVTFQTRSLYQQFNSLISRFYFEHKKEDFDPGFLHIRHSWGSRSDKGVYSEICKSIGITPYNYMVARNKFGIGREFRGACDEAYAVACDSEVKPIYDYVLVDEAQDLPPSFFKLIYSFTKPPKKIVWAYDELQNLSNDVMLPPDELFGFDENGTARVRLINEHGKPMQDIMLDKCYRNPPWTLSLALSLGLGIYRNEGMVRMFKDPKLWETIGYEIVAGDLSLGSRVVLQKTSKSTPQFFKDYISADEAIVCKSFNDKSGQAQWVAERIEKNIKEDELEMSDILVVFPDPYTMSSDSSYLREALRLKGIESHIAGADYNRDIMFYEESVALAHVYRAKGNEAPMVYMMDSNYCFSGFDLGKKRNFLFTAITRAKGWVRILGVGPSMEQLKGEVDCFFDHDFRLDFQYPTQEQLDEMEGAYQERSHEEVSEMREGFERMKWIKRMLDNGKLTVDDLPEEFKGFFQ